MDETFANVYFIVFNYNSFTEPLTVTFKYSHYIK